MKFREIRSKIISDYAVIPFLLCLVGQLLSYFGTRVFNGILRGSVDNFLDISSSFDKAIPLVPAWVSIYFLCYVFWVVNYLMIAKESKELCCKLLTADMVGKLICLVVFVVVPTTAVRPVVPEGDFWSPILELLYLIDRPDNLFPSMHCLVSWFAMRYAFKCKKIKMWYKLFSILAVLSIFASVLFTKQHVIVDIIGGVAVAEVSILLSERTKAYRLYYKLDIYDLYYGRKKDRE